MMTKLESKSDDADMKDAKKADYKYHIYLGLHLNL